MKNTHGRDKRGTTLSELLIATFIFGFLTTIMLGIINFGTASWKKLESRSTAEKEVRRALLDVTKNVKNTDIRTVSAGIYNKINWMCFKTATALELYDSENIGYDSTSTENTSTNMNDYKSKVHWSYYILYYCMPPPGDGCNVDDPATNSYKCPHKWLIKKYLIFDHYALNTSYATYEGSDSNIKIQPATNRFYLITGSPDNLETYLTATESYKNVDTGTEKALLFKTGKGPTGTTLAQIQRNMVKVVSKNVLAFIPAYQDPRPGRVAPLSYNLATGLPEVQFTVKCFKVLEYARSGEIGTLNLQGVTNTSFSVQVDQAVIPYNNYSASK